MDRVAEFGGMKATTRVFYRFKAPYYGNQMARWSGAQSLFFFVIGSIAHDVWMMAVQYTGFGW